VLYGLFKELKSESKEEGERGGEVGSGGGVDGSCRDNTETVGAYLEDGSYTCDGLSLGIAAGSEPENRRGVAKVDTLDDLAESGFGRVCESVFGPAVSATELLRINGGFIQLSWNSCRFTDSELHGVFSSKRNPNRENSRKKRNVFKEGEKILEILIAAKIVRNVRLVVRDAGKEGYRSNGVDISGNDISSRGIIIGGAGRSGSLYSSGEGGDSLSLRHGVQRFRREKERNKGYRSWILGRVVWLKEC